MAEVATIDIAPRYLSEIQSILARHAPSKEVWAYGSRVKGSAERSSDLDCIIFGATASQIAHAQEAFDESAIPFAVSLLSWEAIPEEFRRAIREHYFTLQGVCG